MPELVVLSGKGGTGKTSIAACFAVLARQSIIVDCDVDAANLHLVLNPQIKEKYSFVGGLKAVIKDNDCIQCGQCEQNCRFDAIKDFQVNSMQCEGCAVCYYTCPAAAIELNDHISGEYYVSDSCYGTMVHGKLGIAEGNSGKLVAEIKKKARIAAGHQDLIIIDGPPGIGCPVVSSLVGADVALVVAEPTVSGVHDLVRVLELISKNNIEAAVCINKADLSAEQASVIRELCRQKQIAMIGEVKFDQAFVEALNLNLPLVKYDSDSVTTKNIEQMWANLLNIIKKYY